MSRDVHVYADWDTFDEPMLVGVLTEEITRRHEHFRFNYDEAWLVSPHGRSIDPDLGMWVGDQHAQADHNFRTFLDSCPDRWGRVLLDRREAILARQEARRERPLYEVDYLLGVHDIFRMGALRFKTDPQGPFLDDDEGMAAPPFASLGALEHAASRVLSEGYLDDPDMVKWIAMLISPGSSLGGARPKASVVDEQGYLWIAKFPGAHDTHDVAAWEYVVHKLAVAAGISMSACQIRSFESPYGTFMTRRFDRTRESRIHFSSAMTQLGYYDGDDTGASYLEIAEFLIHSGANTRADLEQLWRRIVFSICVSNSDDHLRNHGFILTKGGWVLSPAYDLNAKPGSRGLHLNINETDNALDFELALSVADLFQLKHKPALNILTEVGDAVSLWEEEAVAAGLSRTEQEMMRSAFNLPD